MTDRRLAEATTEVISHCRADLRHLADDLRWAHVNGFFPGNAAPGPRDTGRPVIVDADGEEINDSDPDLVAAPMWDIGLADHAARRAYQQTARPQTRAELQLAMAVWVTGLRRRQPPLVKPTEQTNLALRLMSIDSMQWRLTTLERDLATVPLLTERRARWNIGQARNALDRCIKIMTPALSRGRANEEATADPQCAICGIRPRADRTAGRCHTCWKWKQRNGYERPTTADDDELGASLAAAARRRARGEGWGVA